MEFLNSADKKIINFAQKYSLPFARLAIFVVYFWFGILKVFSLSPANPLVADLLEKTLPFISFSNFIILLGIFEMLIGILFLIKGAERVVMPMLVLHMVTVFMPLVMLPSIAWQSAFVPTLEGQYIIKNLLIIALAMVIASRIHPFKYDKTKK